MDNHSTKKISLDGFKVLGTDGKVKCILGQNKYHHNISKSEPDKSSDKNIIIKIVIS